MKKCPNCKILHAEYAEECECGYSFRQRAISSAGVQKTSWKAKVLTGAAAIVIAPILAAGAMKALGVGQKRVQQAPTDQQYEKAMVLLAQEINSGLPMTIDSETRADSVTTGPGRKITYFMTLTSRDKSNTDVEALRATLESRATKYVCTSPDMSNFRSDKAVVAYEYRDRHGKPLIGIIVYPRDCMK